MAATSSHNDWLKQEMNELIESVELGKLQQQFLRGRWLDQLLWFDRQATRNRFWHYRLRLITIIAGALVPALVSLSPACSSNWEYAYKVVTVSLSLLVAIFSSLEGFFQFGERWRHYRRSAEGLKIVGWQFFQLSGPFQNFATHADAYPTFVAHVEDAIQRDVEAYVTQVATDKQQPSSGGKA